MASLAGILGKTAYLDTNLFIYAVEGYEPEQDFVRELFSALERGDFAAATSELTLAELLVKPFELGREDVVSAYSDPRGDGRRHGLRGVPDQRSPAQTTVGVERKVAIGKSFEIPPCICDISTCLP